MMKQWLQFDPVFPLPLTLLLMAIAIGVLVWKDYRNGQNKWVTTIGIVLVCIGLGGILVHPSWLEKHSRVTILLTDGFERMRADSVTRLYPGADLLVAPTAGSFPGARRLTNWHELSHIHSVEVILGNGIPAHASELLDDHKTVFVASAPPEGLVNLDIPPHIKLNRACEIRGEYLTTEPVTLQLVGPGGIADSVSLSEGKHTFSLQFTPTNEGIVTLALNEKKDRVQTTSRIGLNVEKAEAISILLIQDHPTFESGYLKNFLASQHRLAVRYRLSRNVFRYEYVNMAAPSQQGLTEPYLDSFDLIIVSAETFEGLSRGEKREIISGVQRGLGVLFISPGPETGNFREAAGLKGVKRDRDTVHLTTPSSRKLSLTTSPYQFQKQAGLHSVIDKGESVLTGFVDRGFGKIGYSMFGETYPLLLRGDSASYAWLWMPVIESTARRKLTDPEARIVSPMPLQKDMPIHLEIFGGSNPPELYLDSIQIPVKESVLMPGIWHATVWSSAEGWNTINGRDGSVVLPFFVNADRELESIRRYHTREVTAAHSVSAVPDRISMEWRSVSPLAFYLFFVTGMALQWLVPKLT